MRAGRQGYGGRATGGGGEEEAGEGVGEKGKWRRSVREAGGCGGVGEERRGWGS